MSEEDGERGRADDEEEEQQEQHKDGRAIDIHGWNLKDGNNVGVENSVHGNNVGTQYVFTVV
jgi:hypothetical protein